MENEQFSLLFSFIVSFIKLFFSYIFDFIKFIYPLLSTCLEIVFTACIGYYFFLKQFLNEKRADRQGQINLQKDQLDKEIFDQISLKIENSYQALSEVNKYYFLLKNKKPENLLLLEKFISSFGEKYFELHEKINSLFLTIEKYDFVIDPEYKEIKIILTLQKKLSTICSKIEKVFFELKQETRNNSLKDMSELDENLETLLKVCSEINLQLQKVAQSSKELIKNIFKSLDLQIKKENLE